MPCLLKRRNEKVSSNLGFNEGPVQRGSLGSRSFYTWICVGYRTRMYAEFAGFLARLLHAYSALCGRFASYVFSPPGPLDCSSREITLIFPLIRHGETDSAAVLSMVIIANRSLASSKTPAGRFDHRKLQTMGSKGTNRPFRPHEMAKDGFERISRLPAPTLPAP